MRPPKSKIAAQAKDSFVKGLKLGPKGTYIYRIKVKGNIRTGDTGESQLKKATVELVKIRAGWLQEAQGRKKAPTFNKMLELWQAEKRGIKTSRYITGTVNKIKIHFSPNLGDKKIDTITKSEIQECLSKYADKVNENRKIKIFGGYNKLIDHLAGMFSLMKNGKYITSFELPDKQKSQERKYDVLTKDQIDLLFEVAEKRYGLKITVALAMGCYLGTRVSEIVNAEYHMIDWKNKLFSNDKTKAKEAKTIPICDDMLDWFRKWQTRDSSLKVGLLFTDEQGAKLKLSFLDWPLEYIGDNIFHKHLTPHTLRRSFITICHNEGVPLGTLMKLARHANISQTMTYVKVGEAEKVKAIDEVFNKKTTSGKEKSS